MLPAAAVLIVIDNSTLSIPLTIILSLINSSNIPQQHLFDILTTVFQAFFPILDMSSRECGNSALFRK